MSAVNLFIRIDLENGLSLGPGSIALLEAIQTTGSITGAARSIGRSYRWTWLAVDEINQGLHEPAVTASAGGTRGGRAVVTAVGERVIELYHAVELKARSATGHEFHALGMLGSTTRRSGVKALHGRDAQSDPT